MDVTLRYTVNSTPVVTVYPNSKISPDFNISTITLTLETGTTNYDTLDENMSNSPTDIDIEFTSMGETRIYDNLILSNCKYTKILNEDLTNYQMQMIFGYSS